MSIRVMALVWNTNLSSIEKLVLLYYADRANDDGSKIFPSNKTVMNATSLSERSVRNATKRLIEKGYLRHVGWSGYHTKVFAINIARMVQQTDGGITCRNEGQEMPEKGAGDAPKPSVPIKKPSYRKENQKLLPGNQSIEGYIPEFSEEIQEALNSILINS